MSVDNSSGNSILLKYGCESILVAVILFEGSHFSISEIKLRASGEQFGITYERGIEG